MPEVGVITHDFDAKYCRAFSHKLGVSALLPVLATILPLASFFFTSTVRLSYNEKIQILRKTNMLGVA